MFLPLLFLFLDVVLALHSQLYHLVHKILFFVYHQCVLVSYFLNWYVILIVGSLFCSEMYSEHLIPLVPGNGAE